METIRTTTGTYRIVRDEFDGGWAILQVNHFGYTEVRSGFRTRSEARDYARSI